MAILGVARRHVQRFHYAIRAGVPGGPTRDVRCSRATSRPDGILIEQAYAVGEPSLMDLLCDATALSVVILGRPSGGREASVSLTFDVADPVHLPLELDCISDGFAMDRVLFRHARLVARSDDSGES